MTNARLTNQWTGAAQKAAAPALASILGAALALGASAARADGVPSGGTIIGVFSNVVTQGYVTHFPTISSPPYFYDNSSTAAYSIDNSADTTLTGAGIQATGSKLQWGVSSSGVAPEDSFSELIFFGGQVPANIHDPFQAGVITYLNGTSDLNSLVFGADLSFYVNSVSPESFLGTDKIIITTTSNLGVDLAQDADYINICGNGSNVCGTSVEAFEDSEGGTGVTVDLTAQIVGDPMLDITDVALAPGQDPLTSGVLGNEAPLGSAVPEPATWAMMLTGFAGLGFASLRAGGARSRLSQRTL